MSKPRYIDAAFRSTKENEAYLFMKNEYVLMNYAPGSKDDRIVNGPLLIRDGYPSLKYSEFGNRGIDCAFDCEAPSNIIEKIEERYYKRYCGQGFSIVMDPYPREDVDRAIEKANSEAFIFSGNLCARINYAPHSMNDRILSGPIKINYMFPFFRGTVFENGIDAAFSSSKSKEAYLFKGYFYARINYESKHLIQNIQYIRKGFPSLVGTVFESGIDAAFSSHREDEAYIFKGEYYALIDYAPGTTDDYIIGGVKRILDHWPSLRGILPRYD